MLTRILRVEAGDGPAERKEWAMSTHGIRTTGRFRAAAVAVFLALAISVTVLTVQARSILSTPTKPIVRPAPVQIDPYPSRDDWYRAHSSAIHRRSLRQSEAKTKGR